MGEEKKGKCFKNWALSDKPQGIGSILQGIGAVLIGIAAIVTLCRTSGLIDEIYKIQDQAKNIDTAVQKLDSNTKQIHSAIKILKNEVVNLKASRLISNSNVLQKNNSADIIETELELISEKSVGSTADVYIPDKEIRNTAKLLSKTKDQNKRLMILRNSMSYKVNKNEKLKVPSEVSD